MENWKTYDSHQLGFDLTLNYPPRWVAQCDGSNMVILFTDDSMAEQMPLLNILRQNNRKKTLEQFTSESLRQLQILGNVGSAITTKLSGQDARSVEYGIPNSQMKCHQIWTAIGDSVIIFTFFKEISAWDEFSSIIKKICQSTIIGQERQEHVILKTYLIPGLNTGETIQIRCPHTWTAEITQEAHDKKTGILCNFHYKDQQCSNRVVLSYDNTQNPKDLGEYRKLLKFQLEKMLATSGNYITFEECQLGSLPAERASLESPEDGQDRLVLYYAIYREAGELEKSPANGLLFLRCEYIHNPNNKNAMDIIQRIAASIQISKEDIKHDDLFTYENLSWGFGLQYNGKKSIPKKLGTVMKLAPLVPVLTQKAVDPNIGTPGEFIPIIKPIVSEVEDMSLDIFVQDAIKVIEEEDGQAKIMQSKLIRTKDLTARALLIQSPKDPDQYVLTYLCRNDKTWYILRWLTTEMDYKENEKYIESVFKSFYFFRV